MSKKKKLHIFLFLFLFTDYVYANSFKVIITVDNEPITHVDIENEKKILSILNKKKISNNFNNIAINNLIENSLKKKEIKKEKLKIDNSLIDNYFSTLVKNLNINTNEINENLILLIKEKIEIDKLWNTLILKRYSWKISVNMQEIDQKISSNYKKEDIPIEKVKENLVLQEKNKKLAVFSKYHLNMLKKQSLIKYFK